MPITVNNTCLLNIIEYKFNFIHAWTTAFGRFALLWKK